VPGKETVIVTIAGFLCIADMPSSASPLSVCEVRSAPGVYDKANISVSAELVLYQNTRLLVDQKCPKECIVLVGRARQGRGEQSKNNSTLDRIRELITYQPSDLALPGQRLTAQFSGKYRLGASGSNRGNRLYLDSVSGIQIYELKYHKTQEHPLEDNMFGFRCFVKYE
jgi:hypothetical protein